MAICMLFLLGLERSFEYSQPRRNDETWAGGGEVTIKIRRRDVNKKGSRIGGKLESTLVTFVGIQKIENLICKG